MENEVIIDGCNVAECEHRISCLNDNKDVQCKIGIYRDDDVIIIPICKDNPNCYYKQLQRAKAENEKLKDKAYKDADMIYRLTEENREYDIDLSIEKEAHKSTIERLDKYHKALEDIREIAKTKFVNGLSKEADIYNVQMIKIENTINEVLNEE